jgi:hypothetical protein
VFASVRARLPGAAQFVFPAVTMIATLAVAGFPQAQPEATMVCFPGAVSLGTRKRSVASPDASVTAEPKSTGAVCNVKSTVVPGSNPDTDTAF